jgi:hypothetical protein
MLTGIVVELRTLNYHLLCWSLFSDCWKVAHCLLAVTMGDLNRESTVHHQNHL